MAHTEQTKLQFLELRAREQTLEEISAMLGVCRRTLVDWNREFAHDIADLREVEREALRRKLFGTTHDWMKGELDHYKRLDTELARREFKYSPTESVFRMRADSRKTIEKFLFAESPLDRPRQCRLAPKSKPDVSADLENPAAGPDAQSSNSDNAAPVAPANSQTGDPESGSRNLQLEASSIPNPPSPVGSGIVGAGEAGTPATSILVSRQPTPRLAQLDPDDPNFYDESIVIEPNESARSILERYGVKPPTANTPS